MTVEYTLLALAVPALLAAAGFAVWTRLRTRRMLDTLGFSSFWISLCRPAAFISSMNFWIEASSVLFRALYPASW